VTLGMALVLTGISWLCLFGCAIVLSGLIFSGRLVCGRAFRVFFAYAGLFFSLVFGVLQFIQAEQHGLVWLRVPPHWAFVVFTVAVWLSAVVGGVRAGRHAV